MNIFELKQIDEAALLELVRETCNNFPNLKQVYDDDFLKNLVTRRFCFDNYLLWLLASREQYAIATLTEISKFIDLLKEGDFGIHFKDKLRSTNEPVFNSYLIELEFAAYYKEKGYYVQLEPKISDSGKNPEFKITSENFEVYFEAKSIFWEEMMTMSRIETTIQDALGRTKEKYVFLIYYTPKFKSGDTSSLRRFVIEKLKEIPNNRKLPIELLFQNETDLLAKIEVVSKPKKLPYGYLGGFMRTEAFSIPGGREIRRKISQKIPQLPKDEAGVLVIAPGQIFVHEEDVLNALYGDENAVINLEDDSARFIRIRNGTFSPGINTRLSAVIFFKKKWDEGNKRFTRDRVVFHNPFAKKKLTADFFKDTNVKQFVPILDDNSIRMVWK
jgi:hypothetical protein